LKAPAIAAVEHTHGREACAEGSLSSKKNDGFQKYKNKTVGLTGEKGCVL